MKTNIFIASAVMALAATAVSCSDNYDIYPAEYESVVMIKDAGEMPVQVFSTDDVSPISLTIFKGGTADKVANVTLRAMTQAEFDAYLTESGRPYSILPSNCYSFSAEGNADAATVSIAANETYTKTTIYLNTEAVGQYLESYDNPLYSPVIPVVLESADATVNDQSFEVFVMPSYTEPTLMFSDSKLSESRSRGLNLSADGTFTTTVSLPVENRWDLEFDITVDPDLVDAYNAANGTSYTSMSPEAIIGSTHFTMPAGKSSVDVSFKVNTELIDLTDALGIRITGSTVEGIEPDTDAAWLVADLNIPLTADMFSSNALEPSEGSLANLLDGNLSTYFHSAWSVTVDDNHYLQVTLPEGYSKVQIEYSNRVSGTPNALGDFNVYAGTSSADLTLVREFRRNVDALNSGSGQTTVLEPLTLDGPRNVFRIENLSSFNGNKFFVLTEFRMRGL